MQEMRKCQKEGRVMLIFQTSAANNMNVCAVGGDVVQVRQHLRKPMRT